MVAAPAGAGGFLPSGFRRIALPQRFDVIDNTSAAPGKYRRRAACVAGWRRASSSDSLRAGAPRHFGTTKKL
jgi:hypothetical protein